MFSSIAKSAGNEEELPEGDTDFDTVVDLSCEERVKMLSPFKFMREHKDICIYKVKEESSFDIRVTECAPSIFKKIR